jgi:hypothetical protein
MATKTQHVKWFVFHRENSRISRGPDGLRIVIPYWVGLPSFSFLLLWTCFAGYYADQTHSYLGDAFVLVGMCALLWITLGREVVSFRAGSFTVWRGMLGIGRSRTFDFVAVKDVRVGSFLDPKAQGKWDPSFVRAVICFEDRGKVCRFGNDISEFEATNIVAAIREYYPQLVYRAVSV